MLIRRIVVVLLLIVTAIVANSWSRKTYRAGGVHNWTESREVGWPCSIGGYFVDYTADYGSPPFSQPTTYHWKIRPPTRIIWFERYWLFHGVYIGGIALSLGWWGALAWMVWSITCGERLQFGLRQLLLLPVLVGTAFMLSKMF